MKVKCRFCKRLYLGQSSFLHHIQAEHAYRMMTENEKQIVHTKTNIGACGSPSTMCHDCSICGRHFSSGPSLISHILTHIGAITHFCRLCYYSTLSEAHLSKHVYGKHGGCKVLPLPSEDYKCDACSLSCKSLIDLTMHYCEHLQKMPFSCGACKLMFEEEIDFIVHSHLHSEALFCFLCGRNSDSRDELLTHVLAHRESKLFTKFDVKALNRQMLNTLQQCPSSQLNNTAELRTSDVSRDVDCQQSSRNAFLFNDAKSVSNDNQYNLKKKAERPSVDSGIDCQSKMYVGENTSLWLGDDSSTSSNAIDADIFQNKKDTSDISSTSFDSDSGLRTSDTPGSDTECIRKQHFASGSKSTSDVANADSSNDKTNGFEFLRCSVKNEPEIQNDIDYLCEVVMEGKSFDLEHFMSDFPLSQKSYNPTNKNITPTHFWDPADPQDFVEIPLKELEEINKSDTVITKNTVPRNIILPYSYSCDPVIKSSTEIVHDQGFSFRKNIFQKEKSKQVSSSPLTYNSIHEAPKNPLLEVMSASDISGNYTPGCNLNVKRCLILDDKQQIQLVVPNDTILDFVETAEDQTSMNNIRTSNTKKSNGKRRRSHFVSKKKKSSAKRHKRLSYVGNSYKGFNTKISNKKQKVQNNFKNNMHIAHVKSYQPGLRLRSNTQLNSSRFAKKGCKSSLQGLPSGSEMGKAKPGSAVFEQPNTRFRQQSSRLQSGIRKCGAADVKLAGLKELSVVVQKLPSSVLRMQSLRRVPKKTKFKSNKQLKSRRKFPMSQRPCSKPKTGSTRSLCGASPDDNESKRLCLRSRIQPKISSCIVSRDSQRPFLRSRMQSQIKMHEVTPDINSLWPDIKDCSVVLNRLPSYVLSMRSYRRYCREQKVSKLNDNKQTESKKLVAETVNQDNLLLSSENTASSSRCKENFLPEARNFQMKNDDPERKHQSNVSSDICVSLSPTIGHSCEIVVKENVSNIIALNMNPTRTRLKANKKCSILSTKISKKLSKNKHNSFSNQKLKKVGASITKIPSNTFTSIRKKKKLSLSSVMNSSALKLSSRKASVPDDLLKDNKIVNSRKNIRNNQLIFCKVKHGNINNSEKGSYSGLHHQTVKDSRLVKSVHSSKKIINEDPNTINIDKVLTVSLSKPAESIGVSRLKCGGKKFKRMAGNRIANNKNFSKENVLQNLSDSEETETASSDEEHSSFVESSPSFFYGADEPKSFAMSPSNHLTDFSNSGTSVIVSSRDSNSTSDDSDSTSDDSLLSDKSRSMSKTDKVSLSSDENLHDSSSRFCDRSVIGKSRKCIATPENSTSLRKVNSLENSVSKNMSGKCGKMTNKSAKKLTIEMKTFGIMNTILSGHKKKRPESFSLETPKKMKNILYRHKKKIVRQPCQDAKRPTQEHKLNTQNKSKESKIKTLSKSVNRRSKKYTLKSRNNSNCLSKNQELTVQLHKLPESIYQKYDKGKPIMLANLPPVVENVRSLHNELKTVADSIFNEHSYCVFLGDITKPYPFLEHNYSLCSGFESLCPNIHSNS